jgi:hypothetical protein
MVQQFVSSGKLLVKTHFILIEIQAERTGRVSGDLRMAGPLRFAWGFNPKTDPPYWLSPARFSVRRIDWRCGDWPQVVFG